MYLTNSQKINEQLIDELLGIKDSFDIGKRELYLYDKRNLIYTNNFLVNTDLLIQIIQSLFLNEFNNTDSYFDNFYKNISSISVMTSKDLLEIETEVLKGLACIIVADFDKAIIIDIRNYPTRGLSEPDGEKVVRGSKEGFTENIATNVALIRRRIRSGKLKVKKFVVGDFSKTEIAYVYIDDLVNKVALNTANQAISSPMLETSIDGARAVLINITGGSDISIMEIDEAAQRITDCADPEANIIFGAGTDETLEDEVRITVIATGFEKEPFPTASKTADADPIVAAPKNDDRPARDGYYERQSEGVQVPPIFDRRVPQQSYRNDANDQRDYQPQPSRYRYDERDDYQPPRRNERVYQDDGFGEVRTQPRRGFTPDVPSFLKRRDEE